MNISSILWPENPRAAVILYLGFLFKIVRANELEFSTVGPDPLVTAQQFMTGALTEAEYRDAAIRWWNYLDGIGATRDLKSKDALLARVAICLLSANEEEAANLGDHLSWFFEVLESLGINLDKPIEMMTEYFESKG